MKKYILILFAFISIGAYSQSGYIIAGSSILNGADTAYHRTDLLKQASQFVQFQVSYDTIAGSPTGYSVLQASVDGKKWATLTTVEFSVYTSGNDTMSYDTYDVNIWGLSGLPFNYLRSMNVGSVGDTLTVNSVYSTKKY